MTWYLARASGIVAYVLLGAAVLWGLVLSTRSGAKQHRPWVLDVHRMLGALATLVTFAHVSALMADSYVEFDLADVLVPLASSWAPTAVASGVLGLYVLVAVELTSLARRRLPARLWRAVHFASFALFGLATLHFAAAGTDAANPVLAVSVVALTAAVAALTGLRASQARRRPSAPSRPARREASGAGAGRPAPAGVGEPAGRSNPAVTG